MAKDRRAFWLIVKYFGFCATIVALRGFGLAAVIHGTYSAENFAIDTTALFCLMAFCHLLYFILGRALVSIGIVKPAPTVAVKAFFVVFLALPFLFATIQLHPQKIAGLQHPSKLGIQFEDVSLPAANLTLRGWLLNPGGSKPPLLLLHGLNANKGNFLPIAAAFAAVDYPVLIFDLEGHGESDGRLTTLGFREKRDVAAGVAWLRSRYPGRAPVALGYSLGGAALLQFAADDFPFQRIVVDATYSSLREIVDEKFLRFTGPFEPALWYQLTFWGKLWTGFDLSQVDNRDALRKLDSSRLMLIHGTEDAMISFRHCRLLEQAARGPILVWEVKGANHLQTVTDPQYVSRVDAFLNGGS
ncbi:MAG: alpha/beta hydrolase [Bdellovibrionota bacterium]